MTTRFSRPLRALPKHLPTTPKEINAYKFIQHQPKHYYSTDQTTLPIKEFIEKKTELIESAQGQK